MKYLTILPILAALVFSSCEKEYLNVTGLTELETDDLTFLREEEKLARDVYAFAGELYDLAIFDNIAAAEQRHMDKLLAMLNYYGIDDPVISDERGVFRNIELQQLYDDLILEVSKSPNNALIVGVLIEDQDIADLEVAIANTNKIKLDRVYDRLLAASHNHLRAFNSQILPE